MIKEFEADKSLENERLDKVVSSLCGISRAKANELIIMGFVRIFKKQIRKPAYKVHENEKIEIMYHDPAGSSILPENIPLDIIYEDDDIIVVNKPKGMLTHPTPKEETGTLVNALLYHTKDLALKYGVERAGIVHRLDRDTSGIIVVAKNNISHAWIAEQFQKREVVKHYIAIVYGNVKQKTTDIIVPLEVNHKLRKVVPSPKGKFAATRAFKIGGNDQYNILKVRIFTGRTHQIRVHMEYIGHPVVGDLLYALDKPRIPLYKTSLFIPPKSVINSIENRDFQDKGSSKQEPSTELSDLSDDVIDPPVTAQYGKKTMTKTIDYTKPTPLLLHAYSIEFTGINQKKYKFCCEPPGCFQDFIDQFDIPFNFSKIPNDI